MQLTPRDRELMERKTETREQQDEVFGAMKKHVQEDGRRLLSSKEFGVWIKENQPALIAWGKRKRGEV